MSSQAWSPEEVGTQIAKIGLGQYSPVFIEQEIDGSVLADLRDGDLREMGLTIGARIAVTQWILSLSTREEVSPEPDRVDYPEPADESAPDATGLERTRCPTCNRNFDVTRIERHTAVCGRAANRRPFDSQKMRTRELEVVTPPQSPVAERDEDGRRARSPAKKRPIWDARAKRLEGTGAEEFFKEEEFVKPNRDFRKGDAALREVIQTARRLAKLRKLLESE
jgi:hypothetical protein